MGKPFSDLEKRAFAILANGGDPSQSLDSALANYWRWRVNPSAASRDLPDASTRTQGRKLDDVAIRPFGINLPTNTFAKVTISQRSKAWASTELATVYQHVTPTDAQMALRLGRFSPARVYARTGAAGTPIPRTSRITEREYKTYYDRADQGYSIPFGETADPNGVQNRQTAITEALQTEGRAIELISFSPEKVRA